MVRACLFALALIPLPAMADRIDIVLDHHVLPGYDRLVSASQALAATAEDDCRADSPELRAAFHESVEAWLGVSHLRFGPSEEDDRAFALAFWPDTRGMTPRGLGALISDADPIAAEPEAYPEVSIAARGFYAMEFLLFDPTISQQGDAGYRCQLTQTVATDIALTSMAIRDAWQAEYADLMRNAGENDRYQSEAEALRAFLGALTTGLEFTADMRLGRPLGTFERPRPNRAEMRRSERSLANVIASLRALADLAEQLSVEDPEVQEDLALAFGEAITRAQELDDPVLMGVADPARRFRVEALQQRLQSLRTQVVSLLGPELGVAPGFNALDGD